MQVITASISLPVSLEAAFRVISDLNTLLRLSPFFTLTRFESSQTGTPQPGARYSVTLEYYATRLIETHRIAVDMFEPDSAMSFSIEEGAFRGIRFAIERSDAGIRLMQTLLLEAADETVMAGSQKELQLWLRSIGEYIKLAAGTSIPSRLAARFMDKVWLKLTLSERNIAVIITRISALELALLLILVLVWRMFG